MRHDDAQPSRNPLALLLVAAFGAGVAGGLAAHWLDGDPTDVTPEHVATREAGEMAAVATEVRALTQAVEALAARPVSGAASSDGAERNPEPLRSDSSAALEAAITRLADALARGVGQRPAVADRASMTLPADPQAALARLAAVRARDLKAARGEHLFRSAADIIELYGLPDEIEVHDRTVTMIYRSIEGGWQQSFSTLDGLVVNYYRSE